MIIFDQFGNVLNKFGCSKHLEFPNGVVVNDRYVMSELLYPELRIRFRLTEYGPNLKESPAHLSLSRDRF